MQLTYAPDQPRLFLLREKPKDPQFKPHAGIKMAQGLVSPSSISVIKTQITTLYKGILLHLSSLSDRFTQTTCILSGVTGER